MRVAPMPTMKRQVGRLGVPLGFIDLNCGWYCERALLDYWFQTLFGRPMVSSGLRHSRLRIGYDPSDHQIDINHVLTRVLSRVAKPADTATWEVLLQNHGPFIVSGGLGPRRVGHWVLIVGADANADTLDYKDPIKGDTIQTRAFAHMNPRIDNDVYFMQKRRALELMNRIDIS